MDPATRKLEELRTTYTPFLEGMIGRLEDKEQRSGQKNVQLERLRSLHKFLTTSQKQPKLDTLEKMENIIKSMHDKVGTTEHTPTRPSSTHQRPSSGERQDHSSSSHHDWRRQSHTHYDSNRKDDRRDNSRRSDGLRYENSRSDSGRGGDDHREERSRHSNSRSEVSRHGHRSDSSSRDNLRSEGSRIDSSRIEGSRSESSRSDSSRSESRPESSRQEHGRHETSRHDSYRYREEHHRRDYGRKEDSKHGRGDRFEDPRHGGRQDERRYDGSRHDPLRHEPPRHDLHRQEIGKVGGSSRPSYSHEERREGNKKQVGSIPPEKASPILTKKSLLSLPMPPVASTIIDSIIHPSSSESHQPPTESSKFLSSREKLQRLFGMNKTNREDKSQSRGSSWGSDEPAKVSESRHGETQWQDSKGRRDVPAPEGGWHHGRETEVFKERSFRNPSPPHMKHSQQQSPTGSTKPGHFIPDTPMSPDHANFGAMDTPQSPELGASFSPTPSTDDLVMVRNIPLENVKGTIDLDIVKNALSFIKEQESKAHGKSPSQPEKDSHAGSSTSTVSTKNSEDEPYDPEEVWKSSFDETPVPPHIPVSTHGDIDLRLVPALTAPHQAKVQSSSSTPVSVVRPQENRMMTSFGSSTSAQSKGNVIDSSVHDRASTSAPPPTSKHSGASPLNIPTPSTFTKPPQVSQPASTDIRKHPPQSPTLANVGNRQHDSKRLHQGTASSTNATQSGDVDMRVNYHPPFHRPSPSTGFIGRTTSERRPSLEDWRERDKGGEQPNRIEGIRSRLAQESNEFIKPGQKGVAFTQLERYKQQRQGRHPGGLPEPKRDMGASPTSRGDGSDSNRKDPRSVLDQLLPEHKDPQDSPSESKASQPYGNRDPRLKAQDSKVPLVPSEPPTPVSRDPRMSSHQPSSSMGQISNHPSPGVTASAHLPSGGPHPMHHPPGGSISSHSPLNHAPIERSMPPSHTSPRDMHTGHHMPSHPPSRDPRQMVSRDPRHQQNHPQPPRPMEPHMDMKMYSRDPRMGQRQMEMQERSRMSHMPPPINVAPGGQGRMSFSSWDAPRAPERLAPPPSTSGSLIGETFTCLMMRGLPRFANSNHIYQYFHDYLLRDMCIELDFTYNCKGTAYVQFPSHLTAKDAFERYSNGTVQGYPVELRICSVGILRQAKTTYGQQNKEREAHLGIPERPRGNCNPYYKPRPKELPKPRPVMRQDSLSEGGTSHGMADKKGGEAGRGGYSALCAVKTGGLQSFKIPKIKKSETVSKKSNATSSPDRAGKKRNEQKGKADKSDSDDELVDIPVTTKKDRKFKKICVVSDSESDSEVEEKLDESKEKTGKEDYSVVTDDREDHDDDSDDSLVIDEEVGHSDSDEEVVDKKPLKAPAAPPAAKGKAAVPKKPKKIPPKKTPTKPAPIKTLKTPKKVKTPKPKAPKKTGNKRGRPKKIVKNVVESPGKLDITTLSQGMKVTRQTLGVLSTEVVKTKLKVTIPVPLREMVTLVKEEVVKKRGRKRKIEVVEEEEKKESSDCHAVTEESSFDPEISEQQPNFEGMITEDMESFNEDSKLMKPKKRKAATPKKGGKGAKKQKVEQPEEEEDHDLKVSIGEDDQDASVTSVEGMKNISDGEEKETSKEFIHKLFIEDEDDDLPLPDLNNLNPSLLDEDPTICNALPDVSALADVLNPTITDEKYYSSNEEKQSEGSQMVTQDDQASSGTSEELAKNKKTAAVKGETEESVNKEVEVTESAHTLGENVKILEKQASKTEKKNEDSFDGSVASKIDTKEVLDDSEPDQQLPSSEECVNDQVKDTETVLSKKMNKEGTGVKSARGKVDNEVDTQSLSEHDGKTVCSSNLPLGEIGKSSSENSTSDTGKQGGKKGKPVCGEEMEIVDEIKESKIEKSASQKLGLSNEVDKVKCGTEENMAVGKSKIVSDSKLELDEAKCDSVEDKVSEMDGASQNYMETKVLGSQKSGKMAETVKSEANKDEVKVKNEVKKTDIETKYKGNGLNIKQEDGNEQEKKGYKRTKLEEVDMKEGDIILKEENVKKKDIEIIEKDEDTVDVKLSGDTKERLVDEDPGDSDKGVKPASSSKATGDGLGKEGSSEPVLLKTGKSGKSGEDDDVGSIELGSVGSFPEDASVVSVDSHDTKASETGRKKRGKTVTPQPPLERRRVTRSVRSLAEPLEQEVTFWDDGGVTDLYQCDQCDYVGRNIVQHLVNIHSEREVPCEFKKEDFYPVLKDKSGPPDGFFDHKDDELDFSWIPQSMTFEETVWCNECDYNSNSRFDLIYHVLIHSPNIAHLAFHCWLCLYMTENMEDFYNHVSSHTGEYRYTCVNCGYKAYKKSALQTHHEECHRTQPEKFEVEDMILEDGWPYIYTCKTCLLVSISHDKAQQHVAHRHMGKGDIFKSNMTRPIVIHHDRKIPEGLASRLKVKSKKGKRGKKSQPTNMNIFVGNEEEEEGKGHQVEEAQELLDRIYNSMHPSTSAKERQDRINILDSLSKKLHSSPARKSPSNMSPDRSSNGGEKHKEGGEEEIDATQKEGEGGEQNESKKSNCATDSEGKRNESIEKKLKKDFSKVPHEKDKDKEICEQKNDDPGTSGENDVMEIKNGEDSVSCDPNSESEDTFSQTSDTESTLTDIEGVTDIEGLGVKSPLVSTILKLKNNLASSLKKTSEKIKVKESVKSSPKVENVGSTTGQQKPSDKNLNKSGNNDTDEVQVIEKIGSEIKDQEKKGKIVAPVPGLVPLNYAVLDSSQQLQIPRQDLSSSFPRLRIRPPEQLLKQPVPASSADPLFCCAVPGCGYKNDQKQLIDHIIVEHGPFKCISSGCLFITKNISEYITHMKTLHSNLRILVCPFHCDIRFSSQTALIFHLTDVHKPPASSVPEKEDLINVEVKDSDSEGFLKIESVSTLDPSMASQMWGEEYDESRIDTNAATSLSQGDKAKSESPSVKKTLPGPGGLKNMPPAQAQPSISTSAVTKTTQQKQPPDIVNLDDDDEEEEQDEIEKDPPGMASLPKIPPTVPVLKRFILFQSLEVFRTLTTRLAPETFKCMVHGCVYATDVDANFEDHAKGHGRDYRCCYCLLLLPTAKELVQHIVTEHSHCSFQCKYCLYRTLTKAYMGVHVRNFHPKEEPRFVIVTNPRREPPPSPPVEQVVHPYRCNYEGCQYRTVDAEVFKSHVATHGSNIILQCHFCQGHFQIQSLIQHMTKHNVNEYQCAYCVYGEAEKEKIFTHLLNCHPGRPGKVLLRRQFVGGNAGLGVAGKSPLSAAPASTASETSKQSTKQPQPSAIQGRSASVNGEDTQPPKVVKEATTPPVQPSRVTRSSSLDASQTRLLSKGSILNKSVSSDGDKLGTGEDSGTTEKLGLSGHDLYRCGNEMCGYSCSSQAQLKEHLQVCDLSRDNPQLQCFHCSRQFRHLSALLDHLRVHGPKRYKCGAVGCDYKATMLHYFKNHMKQVHRMSGYRQVAKDPANKDPETQQFIVYPKDALPIGKEPLRKRKNEFGVEDIEKIPKIHILYNDIKCYHCHFSTKVRLNMVKHLWLHKKFSSGVPNKLYDKTGPATAIPVKHPVNPVPCLERNELMFDKMMNLAGSSFEIKKKKEEVDLRVKNPIPKDELEKLPPFVPEERLNCCGIEGCNYLSCDDIMLKYHIKTLHANVTNFPCPHCKDCMITIEKMNSHFKLHGERLYRCGWCPYLSYKQSLVERHMKDKHWSKKVFDFVIREPEDPELTKKSTDSPLPTDTQNLDPAPTEEPQWQCGLCQFSCVTQQEMVNHVNFKHEIKSQFKCGYCNVRSSVRTSFDVHFAAKHPHEAFRVLCMYYRKDSADIEPLSQDGGKNSHEPLWKRNDPFRIRRIRGILLEDPDEDKKKPWLQNDDPGLPQDDCFVCPICSRFKTNELNTFRAHLCKESDYHRYECSECGISNALLASIQRHYTKVHHSSFTKDCYVELPIEDEKEAWVESIVSHQQALIKDWQTKEGVKPKNTVVSGSQTVVPANPGVLAPTAAKAPLRRRASTEARQQLLLQQELEDQDLQQKQIPVKRLSEGSQVSSTGGAAATPQLGGVVLHDSGSDRGKYSCKLCGAECKSAAGLKSHNTAMHQARFKCMYCPYSSNTEVGVTQHCASKHPKLQNQVVDVTERDKGQKGEEQVGVAGKSDVESESESMQETEENLEEFSAVSSNSKTYNCPHCAFTSSSPQTIAAHKRRQHMDHRPYLCVYCGNRFEHEHDGIRHHKMVHKDKEIQLDYAPQGPAKESPATSGLPVTSSAETNVAKEPKSRKVSAWRRISSDYSVLPVLRKDKSGELESDSGVETNLDYNEDKEYICMHCPARGHRQYIEEHIKIQHRTLGFQITVVEKGGSLTSEVYSYKCQHCPIESKSLSEAMDHWCKCHVSLDFKFQLKLINSTVFGGAEEASSRMKPPKTPRVFDGRSPNPGSISDVDEDLLEPSGDESEGGSSTVEAYSSSGEGVAKTEDFMYACGYCKKSSSQIKDIYDHQLKIHPDKDAKVRKYPREIYLKTFGVFYQCGYCDERLARVPMKQHLTHAHPGCEMRMTKVDSSSNNNICFRCEVCGHVVKRCKSIRLHLQRHHPGYPDTTWTRLTLGSSSRPPVKQPYRCNYCEELGESLEQMQRHHIFLHSHLQESITNLMDEALSSVHGPSSAPSSSGNLLSPGASCSPVKSPPYSSGAISSQTGHTSTYAGSLKSPEAGPSTSLASPVHSVPSSPSYWSAGATSPQEVSTSQRPRLKNTARKSFVTSASRQRMVAFKSTASKQRTSLGSPNKDGTEKVEEEASGEGSITEEFSFYGVKQPKLDLNSIYTTITMGMGIPMRLRTAQVYHLLNLDCKIQIVDLKDSVQQSLTF